MHGFKSAILLKLKKHTFLYAQFFKLKRLWSNILNFDHANIFADQEVESFFRIKIQKIRSVTGKSNLESTPIIMPLVAA